MKKVKEEMTTGDAGIPADTKNMGPSSLFKQYRVLDKRKKDPSKPRILKRFKEYIS